MTTGTLPNVYWQHVSLGELRKHSRFEGLPPSDTLRILGFSAFKYVVFCDGHDFMDQLFQAMEG